MGIKPSAMSLRHLIYHIVTRVGVHYKSPVSDKDKDKVRRDHIHEPIMDWQLVDLKLGGYEADEDEVASLCVDFNSDLIDLIDNFYFSLKEIQTNKKETKLKKPSNPKVEATS